MPRVYKRRMSLSRAAMCENAVRPLCRCRCLGRLHGINHSELVDKMDRFFRANELLDQETVDEMIDEILGES